MREQRSPRRIELGRIGPIETRRPDPRSSDDDAEPIGKDGSARQKAAVGVAVQARNGRRLFQEGSGNERGRRTETFHTPRPLRRRPPRLERNREPGCVDVDRHRARHHVHALPFEDARHEKRRAAAIAVGDVHAVEAEIASGSTSCRARQGAPASPVDEAARVHTIGNDVSGQGIDERQQIPGSGQVGERVGGDRGSEGGRRRCGTGGLAGGAGGADG